MLPEALGLEGLSSLATIGADALEGGGALAGEGGTLAGEGAAAGAEGAPANEGPNFVVSPNGTVFPVPEGATGPIPVINQGGTRLVVRLREEVTG